MEDTLNAVVTSEQDLAINITDGEIQVTVDEETTVSTTIEEEQILSTTVSDETPVDTHIDMDKTVVPGAMYTGVASATTKTNINNTNFTISVDILPEVIEKIDKIEFNSRTEFPNLGKVNVDYVDKGEGITYRWDAAALRYYSTGNDWKIVTIIDGGHA